MSTKIKKPTLSAAQVMADLDSLNKVEPPAALALLNASNNLCPRKLRRKSEASILPAPPKFDSLGKRIVPPLLSRLSSNNSASGGTSGQNTGLDGILENDRDLWRAKELMELFEQKENLIQMGTRGLKRSQARVDEVLQKHPEMRTREYLIRQQSGAQAQEEDVFDYASSKAF